MQDSVSYAEAKELWFKIQKMEPKEKYKHLKKLCYDIQLNAHLSLEEIDFYTKLLRTSVKVLGFPGNLLRKLNKLSVARLEVMGIDPNSIQILLKKNLKVNLETATIGIGDKEYAGEKFIDEVISLVNTGKRIFFSTGSDGDFNVQVRLINAPEPILSVKEYSRVGDVSQTFIITIPSGHLTLTDYVNRELASIDIPPGNYKVAIFVFHLPNDNYSYYICLAPTNMFVSNEIISDHIPTLCIDKRPGSHKL